MSNLILLIIFLILNQVCFAQKLKHNLDNCWQIGIGLGELPIGGSFKPSLTFGYHFNEKVYAGIIYQFKDKIKRDNSSINAKSNGISGLKSASENVTQRFMFQFRITPVEKGPYISTGFVFNGEDSETMIYEEQNRELFGESFDGSIKINQTRPSGGGFAIGLGYQYDFDNGISLNSEWTPAWFKGYPKPSYKFSGSSNLSESIKEKLQKKMDNKFKDSVTNLYKVFHFGISYRFK